MTSTRNDGFVVVYFVIEAELPANCSLKSSVFRPEFGWL